jgi:hypothetical protein
MLKTVTTGSSITVHVRRRLLGQGLVAIASLTVPILLVLLWLTVPNGPWMWVAAAAVAVALVVAYSVFQYFRVSVSVTPTHLVEKTFFGTTNRVPLDTVTRAVLLDLHRTLAAEPRRQLFVLDAEGRVKLRMRGDYWSTASIHKVAEHLVTVPVEHIENALTLDELQRTNPLMLYWFERRPTRLG